MKDQILYNNVVLREEPIADIRNVETIDLGAMPMIDLMCQTGLPIDPDHFARIGREVQDDMERLTERVKDSTGYSININSGDQVSDLLFKKLGLKQIRPKFTKGSSEKEARESVEDQVLKAIQHQHECVPLIQEFKSLSKLKGTYINVIPTLTKPGSNGPTLFPNLGTTTVPAGRLNSWEPNLLAMPNRSKRGKEMCKGFIAPKGWVYLSVDESQIEPRIAAHSSKDKNLINIYENDEDIYSDFAIPAFSLKDERYECSGFNSFWTDGNLEAHLCKKDDHNGHGWHYPSVNKDEHRGPAKTCTLASIYDVTAKGLLEQMPIVCANCKLEATKHTCNDFVSFWTEEKCQRLIDAFYVRYFGLMVDRRKFHAMAKKYGYVWDMWGRVRHAAGAYCYLPYLVAEVLRSIGNHPYQGGAQGTIKLVMAQAHDTFIREKLYQVCRPVLQIHDELLFLCRESFVREIGEYLINMFENVCELRVPIKAGMAFSPTWGEMIK